MAGSCCRMGSEPTPARLPTRARFYEWLQINKDSPRNRIAFHGHNNNGAVFTPPAKNNTPRSSSRNAFTIRKLGSDNVIGVNKITTCRHQSSHQRWKLHTTPPETLSPHAPRIKFVARPFPAGSQTNLADQVEGDEDFAEEEAVCKFCFMKVGEESVIMMTKCRCKSSLAHEECTSRWFKTNGNNCEVCAQEVKLVNCILLGSQKFHNEIQSNGSSFGSWLRRLSLFGKGK